MTRQFWTVQDEPSVIAEIITWAVAMKTEIRCPHVCLPPGGQTWRAVETNDDMQAVEFKMRFGEYIISGPHL